MPDTLSPDSFMAQVGQAPAPKSAKPELTPDAFMESVPQQAAASFKYYANQPNGSVQGSNDGASWTKLPTPQDADQQTTFNAQTIAEVTTRPTPGIMDYLRLGGAAIGAANEGVTRIGNTPLVDFNKIVPGSVGPGVRRGLADVATGLTTPANIGMLALFPEGEFGKLLSLGFSAQQIVDASKQVPEFVDAVRKGDKGRASQAAVKIIVPTLMAALGARHGGTAEKPGKPEVTPTMRRDALTPDKFMEEQNATPAASPSQATAQPPAEGKPARSPERAERRLEGKPGPAAKPSPAPAPAAAPAPLTDEQAESRRDYFRKLPVRGITPGDENAGPNQRIRQVPLTDLEPTQARKETYRKGGGQDVARYRELLRQGSEPPPLSGRFNDETGKVELSEGHRRLEALKAEGRTHAPVIVGGLGEAAPQPVYTNGQFDAGKTFERSKEPAEVKTANRTFVKDRRPSNEDYTLMEVPTEEINSRWAEPPGQENFYIRRGGGGAEIGGRLPSAKAFIATGKPIEAPRVSMQEGGRIDFEDGRHRFAALRDAGDRSIAVMVPNEQVEQFRALGNTRVPQEAAAGRNREFFRGSWELDLNAAGRRQVQEAGQRNAGQFDEIFSGTRGRHRDTAQAYADTNPQADPVQKKDAFNPMDLGGQEGHEVTPERVEALNEHIRNRPEQPLPGVGQFSGVPGEAPKAWASRLIGGVQDVVRKWTPGKKVLIVTSGRDVQAIRAWVAKGMPDDRSTDPDVMTARWETQPGQMMRLDPRTGKTENVDRAGGDGIYFARHGETAGNNNPEIPAEVQAAEQGNRPAAAEPLPAPPPGPASPPAPPAPQRAASAPAESSASSVYLGSGLGALEPLFREAKAEGDRLRANRKAAIAAVKAAEGTPGEQAAGEALRLYYTSERDLWASRANQAIDIVTRKVLPKIQAREALGIMREFRHRPQELAAFIDGSHPYLQRANGGASNAITRLDKLQPVMREALRMLSSPTARERAADQVYTNIAEKSLQEGRAGGWLESRWQSDEYVPHMLNEKGKGELAKMPAAVRRRQGKIGKYFQFAERRQDEYPTMLHAVADGLIPKTLDPSPAFVVHADHFARARATHLLEEEMGNQGMGQWGDGKHVPDGWVQFAPHSDEWVKRFAFEVPDPNAAANQASMAQSGTVASQKTARIANLNRAGVPAQAALQTALATELRIGKMGLYVPQFVADALDPIVAPEQRSPAFARIRTAQRSLKEAILGLSGFHLLTENVMAGWDVGPRGMIEAFSARRGTRAFLENERDLIASGGTTSIQGSVMDAYRGLRPGTIPTRGEILRAYIPGSKQVLATADMITRFTFDNMQRRFKVVSFALHRDAWRADNPHATPEQYLAAKRGIASYVNGVYGGLHWENMGISRMALDVARFFFLAPDWSGSNLALGKYAAFDAALSRAEIRPISRGRLRGATTKETAQARLARAFWTKQIVGGLIATQMLSLLFSGKLSPRPFMTYMGQDKDGREVYQNLVWRGNGGDLVNLATRMEEHGLLSGTGVMLGSKAAPFVKAGVHMITGLDDRGRQIAPKELNPIANTVRSVGTVATDVSPVPITVRNLLRGEVPVDRLEWTERILSLLGPQAQHVTPEGFRMGPEGLEEKQPPEGEPNSIWQQILTGRPNERLVDSTQEGR